MVVGGVVVDLGGLQEISWTVISESICSDPLSSEYVVIGSENDDPAIRIEDRNIKPHKRTNNRRFPGFLIVFKYIHTCSSKLFVYTIILYVQRYPFLKYQTHITN